MEDGELKVPVGQRRGGERWAYRASEATICSITERGAWGVEG